jgi:release factor glutamine methyltransferase
VTAPVRELRPATLGSLFQEIRATFRAAGLDTAELDARWLVAAAAGHAAQDVVLHEHKDVEPGAAAHARDLARRRLGGEPVDRILGQREFWGLTFRLSPATLSPRPDTETIVEAALDHLPEDGRPLRILDLGTGSGAILLALLSERRSAHGVGVDRSAEAARTARGNARLQGLSHRAMFVVGDWAAALCGPFDVVTANPPYLATPEIERLDPLVRDHDPILALAAGEDGLDAYRAILPQLPALLAPHSAAVLEIGLGQEGPVTALARGAGLAPAGPARRDLGGISRALVLLAA